MQIRTATEQDWPAIWPVVRRVVAEGETYAYDRDLSEDRARALWMLPPPGRTVVAVDDDGRVHREERSEPRRARLARRHRELHGRPGHPQPGRRAGPRRARAGLGARAGLPGDAVQRVVETNAPAVALWRSLGLEVLATVPQAIDSPTHGLVGLHVMHRRL